MKTVSQKGLEAKVEKMPSNAGPPVHGNPGLTRLGYMFAGIIIFCSCVAGCNKSASPKFDQYYVQGQKLYEKHCSNCHQKDGSGLGRVYPPLNTSDYMEENFNEVLCLMRHGKAGEIFVNGQQYNQAMPGVSNLSDLEIAEIATYIFNTWGHQRGIVEVKNASEILKGCGDSD